MTSACLQLEVSGKLHLRLANTVSASNYPSKIAPLTLPPLSFQSLVLLRSGHLRKSIVYLLHAQWHHKTVAHSSPAAKTAR